MKAGSQTNYAYVLFGLFFILILYTLFATINMSKAMSNDYLHINDIKNLEILNKDINIILSRRFQYLNDESIGNIRLKIEVSLAKIKKDTISLDNPELLEQFNNLQKDLRQKSHILSWFQFHNERVVNYIETILKFQEKIQKTYYFSEISNLINASLIHILELAQNKDENEKQLSKDIKTVKQLYDLYKLNDRSITSFIHQLEFTVLDLNRIKVVIEKSQKLKLSKTIQHFELSLTNYYKQLHNKQREISYMLAILSIIFLLIIVFYYENRKKLTMSLLNFTKAVENSSNSIVVTDTQSNITYVNPTFCKTTGYSKEETLGKNPRILKSEYYDKSYYQNMYKKITSGQQWLGMFVNIRKNGEKFYEQTSITPITNRGKIESFLAIKLDITDLIKSKEKLELQTQKLETAQKITHIGSFEIYWDTKKIYCSTELKNILKLNKQNEIDYSYLLNIIYKDDRESFDLMINSSLSAKKPFYLKHKIVDLNHNIKYVSTKCEHKYNRDKKPSVSIGTMQDITDITVSQNRVEFIAYHDLLTKLANKEGFQREFAEFITIAKIKNQKLALISMDLDKFKDINETLGHDIGDKVLKTITKRVKLILPKSYTLSRFGGDEFCILIKEFDGIDSISKICDKILKTVANPIKIADYTIYTTISIGVSIYPKDGITVSDILKNSDAAMYLAKNEGRNRYKFYTKSISQKIQERLKIEGALKSAIKNSEFSILYQPQVSPKDKEIVAIEALIRWNSKSIGFVSPNIFIPISEDSGQIIDIGDWVFENACIDFLKLKSKINSLRHVAINVSSIQLSQSDFLDKLKNTIQKIGISATEVEIEITERFLMKDSDKNLTILQSLKDIGFKISIDDFGTGYSSLNYLKKFPIDTVKIDKSFIDNLATNSSDKAIVKAIVNISKDLKYHIVAEGVEYHQQKDIILKMEESVIIQGYLYSKPLDKKSFPTSYFSLMSDIS